MIGERYWATGITIKCRDAGWSVSLEFFDDGFCEADASQGTLCIRYLVADLDRAVDTLKADAERLGIAFDRTPTIGPMVYAEQDGELEDGDHPELRRIANAQAVRLGWEMAYRREAVSAPGGSMFAALVPDDVREGQRP